MVRRTGRRKWVVAMAVAVAAAAGGGCESSQGEIQEGGGVRIYDLGESFKTDRGLAHVLRVQDEYRLVRCIPDGPIAGCYEDILSIPRGPLSDDSLEGARWNEWVDVPAVPGLHIALVGTGRVAVRQEDGAAVPR